MGADAPMVKNGKSPAGYLSLCSCCNRPNTRRAVKHAAKRTDDRAWRNEAAAERNSADA